MDPDERYVPEASEEPVMLVEVFITRRPEGDFLARLSIDEQAGWVAHTADDPLDALEGAAVAARESLSARLRATRLVHSDPG
jgi:hypothetical protein